MPVEVGLVGGAFYITSLPRRPLLATPPPPSRPRTVPPPGEPARQIPGL